MGNRIKPGDILLDKYRVERQLGEGGMAIVLAARHLQLDQMVAFKTMSNRALRFADAVERFMREAQTAVRLHSENVARVMDVGTLPGGQPYMIMEYLEGVDLATVLQRRGVLAAEDAVDFIIQACAAMREAHGEGIVHRDLKPANLFLTQRSNGKALIKVLDFGISKVATAEQDNTLTNEFGTMGSPPYMSPEQARSAKNVDSRTDIWSLGVLLYQLLTGELPFAADNAAEILAKIMYEEPELASDVAPWVPMRLSRILERCFDKNPEDRIQTVGQLAGALVPHASVEGRRHYEQNFSDNYRRRPSQRVPSFGDDTNVESSIVVDGPAPLQLTDFLEQVPATPMPRKSFGTTQAANGELADASFSGSWHWSRGRVLMVGLGLLVLGVAAAAVVALTGTADTRLEGAPVPASQPAPYLDEPPPASDHLDGPTGQNSGVHGAEDGDTQPVDDVDAGVVEIEFEMDDDPDSQQVADQKASGEKTPGKKKTGTKKTGTKKTGTKKTGKNDSDPFGTMD